jgi:hypothetical protein
MTSNPLASQPIDPTARIAEAHDARTLAAALVARLRADGREALAVAVAVALEDSGIIDGNPGHPHVPAGGGA